MLRFNGNTGPAARFVCEQRHGPPPTPRHEAAHSCGKGHEGCVNGSHLSWKLPVDNHADMVVHGTAPIGERHPASRLKAVDVAAIRASKGVLQQELADRYGVSRQHIGNIKAARKWRHL